MVVLVEGVDREVYDRADCGQGAGWKRMGESLPRSQGRLGKRSRIRGSAVRGLRGVRESLDGRSVELASSPKMR